MKLIKKILSRFPSRLPQGMTEFNRFVEDVAWLSELPDNDRLRVVVATFIMQLPPSTNSFSKWRLANLIRKAAANQVASEAERTANEKTKEQQGVVPERTDSVLG